MPTGLKRSKIKDWWVAKSNNKMGFVNILDGGEIADDLLIVGYLNKENEELATSTNRVAKVTKKGVITAKGTFYPFEEAHDLYLHFLIKAQSENVVLAHSWDYAVKGQKTHIVADIERDGVIEKGVVFDFSPMRKYNVMFAGYSHALKANVLLSTFDKRGVCILLKIPDSVYSDILKSSIASKEETDEKVAKVRELLAQKSHKMF
jgi:hypothetical protein